MGRSHLPRRPAPKNSLPGNSRKHKEASALIARARGYTRRNDREAALALLERAARLLPNEAVVAETIGVLLNEMGRPEEALQAFTRALRINPRLAPAHNFSGVALQDLKRFDEAEAHFRAALEVDPGYAMCHSNFACLLIARGRQSEAVAHMYTALQLAPDNPVVLLNSGVVLRDMGEPQLSLDAYEHSLAIEPDRLSTRWNYALALLTVGDFERGWKEHEIRERVPDVSLEPRGFAQPMWDGSPLDGKTILLHPEQGLGDMIQFVRYAREAKARGGRVIVEMPAPLIRLFQTMPEIDEAVAKGAPLPPFDVHSPLMSLPFVLGTTLESVPSEVPYLRAPGTAPEIVSRITAQGLKVGVVWAGNPEHKNDRHRSVGIAACAILSDVPGVSLFSLQKGIPLRELAALPERYQGRITDVGSFLDDFGDTAHAIAALDLVITVDTSVAHLAGAMGKPVWILLPHNSDWRWLVDTDRSPWYPTARLFRQPKLGDWASVVQHLKRELDTMARGCGT